MITNRKKAQAAIGAPFEDHVKSVESHNSVVLEDLCWKIIEVTEVFVNRISREYV